MSFRTVVIKSRCKLEYSLNNLVVRSDKETRINIDEITTLIIQSTQVSLTSALLSQLVEKKIKVIFCDQYSNPQSELMPYYSSFNTREKIVKQMSFDKKVSELVWQRIVIKKIINQAMNLKFKNLEQYDKLIEYSNEAMPGDLSNREGHAAKVYFNALFGMSFSRGVDNDINKYLNYGYSIILSAINREIKNGGYLTEIGIHHIGDTNPFNLSCDFMEPLRPLIDFHVINGDVNNDNFKSFFINILNKDVNYDGKIMVLDNAIHLYILSLFSALNNQNPDLIKFIEYERL